VELKYGLSVTGTVHPRKVITKGGARVGDKLILTKPLGTGIINTAVKGKLAGEETANRAAVCMAALNRVACQLMQEVGVSACTDITGFGLLGHACEMIQDSDTGMRIRMSAVPLLPETVEFARMGMIPGGTYRNKEFRAAMIQASSGLPDYVLDVLFDPQTSGGLFIAVSSERADRLLSRLRQSGVAEAAVVGEVIAHPQEKIVVEE
jgi:selenide,water dikinase